MKISKIEKKIERIVGGEDTVFAGLLMIIENEMIEITFLLHAFL